MPPSPPRNDTGGAPRTQPKKGGGAPFWRTKTLDEMTPAEWESLCDRCGRCCLVKLEDEDTGEILRTDIACRLFDAGSCSCVAYQRRQAKVSDCIKLTPASVRAIKWLPRTCAYRLVRDGKALPPWHPLRSGSHDSVHEAGVSVRGRVGASETMVKLRDYPDHIVDWAD